MSQAGSCTQPLSHLNPTSLNPKSHQHAAQWFPCYVAHQLWHWFVALIHAMHPQVHVFETTIRVLGGLLSGHVLLDRDPSLVPSYDGLLLHLAVDLADRMLSAFDTPSGLPAPWAHLQGVSVVTTCA